jgi:hypothetical protein
MRRKQGKRWVTCEGEYSSPIQPSLGNGFVSLPSLSVEPGCRRCAARGTNVCANICHAAAAHAAAGRGTARPFPVVLCRAGLGSSSNSQHRISTHGTARTNAHAWPAGRQAFGRSAGRQADRQACHVGGSAPARMPARYPCLPFPIRCGKMRGRDWLGGGKALVLGPAFPGGGGGVGQGKWMPWVGVFELAVWSGILVGG